MPRHNIRRNLTSEQRQAARDRKRKRRSEAQKHWSRARTQSELDKTFAIYSEIYR